MNRLNCVNISGLVMVVIVHISEIGGVGRKLMKVRNDSCSCFKFDNSGPNHPFFLTHKSN